MLRLALSPAGGFQIANATIEVGGVRSFAVEGEELVLTGVEARVLASVVFAAVDDGGANGGDNGTGGGDAGTGGGVTDEASSSGDLATTGADTATTWVLTGLASVLIAGAAGLFWLRRRSTQGTTQGMTEA